MQVKILNKIPYMVDDYMRKYGSTKTFLAKKMGYKSKQAFESAMRSPNPTAETLLKFATFFNCKIDDLVESFISFEDEEGKNR
jgi:transcriptional regulator with XRE-family HTH domain